MSDRILPEEEIFETARGLMDPAERGAYIQRACAHDSLMKRRVEQLLQAYSDANIFFQETITAFEHPILPFQIAEAPGDKIGRYKLLDRIGEGGCGVVYLAHQEQPVQRDVALKVIKLGMDTRSVIARFEAERQTLALMDHPNIAKVYDAGATATGRPYFVMELVKGISITQYCDHHRLSIQERLRLLLPVCAAVQHAHQKGIIHRDLKPSNILVTLHDSQAVPKVIDFGIAKAVEGRLAEQTNFTAHTQCQFVGTPAYTSPEQATLGRADIDTRSDIYTLGVLLYELLTGKTPFDAKKLLHDGIDALRHAILLEEPLAPSSRLRALQPSELHAVARSRRTASVALIQTAQGDLDAIVIKCLQKNRAARYQSSLELAGDLQRFLRHEPVLAAVPGQFDRARKWVRRNKTAVAVGTLVIFALLISVGVVFFETSRGRRVATEGLVRLHVNNGARQMNEGDFLNALLSFTEALRLDAGPLDREEAHRIRIASILQRCPKLLGIFGHPDQLNGAVFSPDDKRLLTCSEGTNARIWDLATGRLLFELQSGSPVYSATYSPDNRLIMTVNRTIRLWDAHTGAELPRLPIRTIFKGNSPQPVFSPDSSLIATRVTEEKAQLWKSETGAPVGQELQHHLPIELLTFSPDSRLILTLASDKVARIWDAQSGLLLHSFVHDWVVYHATFSPDSRFLATVGDSPAVTLWDLSTATKQPGPRADYQIALQSVRFSPDGERLLTKTWDRSVQLWDLATGAGLIPPIRHDLRVYHVRFTPDGQRIVTSANMLRMWNVENGDLSPPMLRHTLWRDPPMFSSDGRIVATIRQNQALVWNIATLEPPPITIPAAAFFTRRAISKDQRFKAEISGDNVLRTVEINTDEPVGPSIQPTAMVRQVLFGAENDVLVTESGDTRGRIWDARQGQPLSTTLKTKYDLQPITLSRKDLPSDTRPVGDLVMLSHLLSGNGVDEKGNFQPLDIEELADLWNKLRNKYPDAFRESPTNAFAWHEQQAASCEQTWAWWSALYHLKYLLAERPDDLRLQHRQEYATRALESATTSRRSGRAILAPPRDSHAPVETVDLSAHYNFPLKRLSDTVPNGIQKISGSWFDVRGVVQLLSASSKKRGENFPEAVSGIQVQRKCGKLRFIHSANDETRDGVSIGNYVVHYSDASALTVPMTYGVEVRNFFTAVGEPVGTKNAEIYWLGASREFESTSRCLRAFITTWTNPRVDDEIESIDFVSAMNGPAPFLIALTAE